MSDAPKILAELDELLGELDQLLKNVDCGSALAARGVNVSLAMTAADALRAYLRGEKKRAADDFGMIAEEISTRMARAESTTDGSDGAGGSMEKLS